MGRASLPIPEKKCKAGPAKSLEGKSEKERIGKDERNNNNNDAKLEEEKKREREKGGWHQRHNERPTSPAESSSRTPRTIQLPS